MNAALRPRYTFAEYLDIEERSPEVKHEYVDGEMLAKAGGSVEHSALATTLSGLLLAHLRGGPCRPHGSDLRIFIESIGVATYADVSVVYVLVAQDRRRIEVWQRDGEDWTHTIHVAGENASLASIDYVLSVDELYETAGVAVR